MKIISKFFGIFLAITALLALIFGGAVIFSAVPTSLTHRSLPPAKTYTEITGTREVSVPIVVKEPQQVEETSATIPAPTLDPEQEEPPAISLPTQWNLAVPFTSQAPKNDWGMPFQDACEEASIIMLNAFYTGRTFDTTSATTEILDLIQWETDRLFHWIDTDAEETAQILKERYGYKNVRVEYDITIEDIKREVAKGHPVLVPAAGRLLKNRYFTPPGPIYHMLVVRGWTRDGKIITNDPGTKRGEEYLYDPNILENAIHDLNSGDVLNGRRAMIVAFP